MSQQFPLPGFDLPQEALLSSATGEHYQPRTPQTVFFAICPNAEAAARIVKVGGGLRKEHDLDGGLLGMPRLHVTLHPVAERTALLPDGIHPATRAAAAVAMPSFEVVFDRALSFSGNPRSRPFVLRGGEGTAALAAFRHSLGKEMMKAGLRTVRSYTPHMTLLYDRRLIAEHSIEPIRWIANEFVLIRSHVGKHVHELLGRWPLGVPQ